MFKKFFPRTVVKNEAYPNCPPLPQGITSKDITKICENQGNWYLLANQKVFKSTKDDPRSKTNNTFTILENTKVRDIALAPGNWKEFVNRRVN